MTIKNYFKEYNKNEISSFKKKEGFISDNNTAFEKFIKNTLWFLGGATAAYILSDKISSIISDIRNEMDKIENNIQSNVKEKMQQTCNIKTSDNFKNSLYDVSKAKPISNNLNFTNKNKETVTDEFSKFVMNIFNEFKEQNQKEEPKPLVKNDEQLMKKCEDLIIYINGKYGDSFKQPNPLTDLVDCIKKAKDSNN